MPDFVTVGKTSDIPAGKSRVLEAGGQEIAVFNVNGSFHAVHNSCAHQGGPLGEGILEDTIVTCP